MTNVSPPTKKRSLAQDTADLKRDYHQGDQDAEGVCEDCNKTCNKGRGWWRKVSYEYDEWECLCRPCAIDRIHQWDDYDFEAAEAAISSD